MRGAGSRSWPLHCRPCRGRAARSRRGGRREARQAARAADPGGHPRAGGAAQRRGGPRSCSWPSSTRPRPRRTTRGRSRWRPASRGTWTAPGPRSAPCSDPGASCPPRSAPRCPVLRGPRALPSAARRRPLRRHAAARLDRRAPGGPAARRRPGPLDRGPDDGPGVAPAASLIRVVLDLLLLAVFVATSFAVFLALYQGHEATPRADRERDPGTTPCPAGHPDRARPAGPAHARAAAPPVRRRGGPRPLSWRGQPRLDLGDPRLPTSSSSASACPVSRTSW